MRRLINMLLIIYIGFIHVIYSFQLLKLSRYNLNTRSLIPLQCTSMERPIINPTLSTSSKSKEYTINKDNLLKKSHPISSSSSSSTSTTATRFIHPQVYKMFHRAKYLIQNGENAIAMKLLNRCVEINPFDSHSWLAYARLEAKLGNINRARELFTKAVDKCPNNVHLLHAWGHMEQKFGNEIMARNCWSQAMEMDPNNAYVCHALSNLEIRHRNFDRAKSVLEKVVWVKPTAAICVSLADLERQLGSPIKSRTILKHGLKRCIKCRSQLLLALAWLEEDSFRNISLAANLIEDAIEDDPQNVKVYVAKASMLLRLNKPEEAKSTLLMCSDLDSKDGQHYTMLGTIEMESGDIKSARKYLEEGSKKYPGDQFLMQRWGTLEAKHGDISKARLLFEKSVMIQPHAPTFVAWAILEEEEGVKALSPLPQAIANTIVDNSTPSSGIFSSMDNDDIPELESRIPIIDPSLSSKEARATAQAFAKDQLMKARALFSIGLSVDPLHGPLYHAYGNMEMRHSNTTGARHIFNTGIATNCSDSTSLYHALGLLELKEGNKETAGHVFRKGIELGLKGNREVENGVGFLLHSLGMLELDNQQFVEAKRIFSTGVSLFKDHSQMLLGLGLACLKLGEGELARSHFKASIDADPYHSHAWQSWAVAEKLSGNYDLSRVLFRQGLKKNPHHGALWQAFGIMESELQNIDAAQSLFAESLKRCPDHAQTYQAWAILELKLGNFQKAKALSLSGIRLAPHHSALWTVAGLVELKMKNIDTARRILQIGLKRSPNHGPLYKALGETEVKSGDYEKAREVFSAGLSVDPFCAGLYHAAALLEARLSNIDGLAELHARCKANFGKRNQEFSNDIISQIGAMEQAARDIKDGNVDGCFSSGEGEEEDLQGYDLEH